MADYNGRGVLITGTLESWVLVPLDVAYDAWRYALRRAGPRSGSSTKYKDS
jgi:hypothetical protein